MELLDKVRKILGDLEIEDPVTDVHYSESGNIIGYICSETFANLDDMKSQELILTAFRKRLGAEELVKIHVVFPETPSERLLRMSGGEMNDEELKIKSKKDCLWTHETPNFSKYRVAVDVGKFEDEYKSTYLVINGRENIQTGRTFIYTHELIEFMQLAPNEIESELFSDAFELAEVDIKLHIMKKYDELTEKGQWGDNNMYSYIFQSFELIPKPLSKAIFDKNELKLFQKLIGKMGDFPIKTEIQNCISASEKRIQKQSTY